MSAVPQASPELLAILARKSAPDPKIIAAFETGDIRMAPATAATLRQPRVGTALSRAVAHARPTTKAHASGAGC